MNKKLVELSFGNKKLNISLPKQTDVLKMKKSIPMSKPNIKIKEALDRPVKGPGLNQLVKKKLKETRNPQVVIVISDNTRPVPYKGEKGILWPIIEKLLQEGINRKDILILVANGTHRALNQEELKAMLDSRVFKENIMVKNHNCRDKNNLNYLGKTSRGSKIYINKEYMKADIKILTGLVESHFMAGASGGRKSICPGLAGEETTHIFHGAEMLSSLKARDLVLEGNPCHEESLEIANIAGVDFLVNVTLDNELNLTGVYAGEFIKTHQKAVKKIKEYITLPFDYKYDIVISHGGFVGINHYQVAKAGVGAIPLLKPKSKLIIVSNTTDNDPIGSQKYKTCLHLLKLLGAEDFRELILSDKWKFIPEQWQVQMWAKLFNKIPFKNFIFYSPLLKSYQYRIIPGINGNKFLEQGKQYQKSSLRVKDVIENSVEKIIENSNINEQSMKIAFLSDGPYGIPIKK